MKTFGLILFAISITVLASCASPLGGALWAAGFLGALLDHSRPLARREKISVTFTKMELCEMAKVADRGGDTKENAVLHTILRRAGAPPHGHPAWKNWNPE